MWIFLATHAWSLIAGGGVIGAGLLIAAVLVFGIPAASIIGALLGVVRAAVEFLKTPAGQAVAVVAIFVAGLFIGDIHRTRLDAALIRQAEARGRAAVMAQWQDANAAAEVAKQQREAWIAADIEQAQRDATAALEQQRDDLSKKVSADADELARLSDTLKACRVVSADDARRLRDLVGAPAAARDPGQPRRAHPLVRPPRPSGRAAPGS